jgi:hypothetical protein
MIKFRKNDNWGTYSTTLDGYGSVDRKIEEAAKFIQRENRDWDIDIIDISLRNIFTPETSSAYGEERTYITIMYAKIEKIETKRKEI